MACGCGPSGPSRQSSTASPPGISNPIIFQVPGMTSDGPVDVAVGEGCTINTSGNVDWLNFPYLIAQKVWAHVGSGAEVEGTVSPNGGQWSVSDVPYVQWSYDGLEQLVNVRIHFYNESTDEYYDIYNNRDFFGTSGPSECEYESVSARPAMAAARTAVPVQQVMPRYFRVTAEFGGDVSFGMMAGGLLALNSVFLSYDAHTSTPEAPVWRDVGLPPGVGTWLLRVTHTGVAYEARLSIQSLNETSVLPPLIMYSRHWDFGSRNLLHGVFEIGNTKTSVTLIVEPS